MAVFRCVDVEGYSREGTVGRLLIHAGSEVRFGGSAGQGCPLGGVHGRAL